MLETALALIIFSCLIIYSLTGGADFGGGVWDLLATGPRARDQRNLINISLAPIWEANHVWLIAVIVFLFVGFPKVFAALSIALHVPLTLLLFGIIFRGAAFVFRRYGGEGTKGENTWNLTFAISSMIAPFAIGLIVGGLVSGTIGIDPVTGIVRTDFVSSWLAPFPVALGFFVLALFSNLAAIYLTGETEDPMLREDFRMKGLASGLAVGLMAWICFFLAAWGAPLIWVGLSQKVWSWPFQILTGIVSTVASIALLRRSYLAARILTVIQVILVIAGWGMAQFPYLVFPSLTVENAAAPANVLKALMVVVFLGGILIAPSFGTLFWIFKGHQFVLFKKARLPISQLIRNWTGGGQGGK